MAGIKAFAFKHSFRFATAISLKSRTIAATLLKVHSFDINYEKNIQLKLDPFFMVEMADESWNQVVEFIMNFGSLNDIVKISNV